MMSDEAEADPVTFAVAAEHPSAPIPVQGPGLGSALRLPLGETGLRIFPVILGGAEFGSAVEEHGADDILDAYLESGGNAIHTADVFGGGLSEQIIGRWLRSRRVREDMVVMTRVGAHPDQPGLGPVNLVRSVEASLGRLGVERIDVLYLDARHDTTTVDQVLATVDWLIGAGKVGSLGLRGASVEFLIEARVLASAGYPRVTVVDVPYSVSDRSAFDGDLRLIATAQQLAVTPSRPLDHGFLARMGPEESRVSRPARLAQLAQSLSKRGPRLRRTLEAVAQENRTTVAAVAISWLLAQRQVVAPIANAFTTEHVRQLLQGVGMKISRSQLAEINRAQE